MAVAIWSVSNSMLIANDAKINILVHLSSVNIPLGQISKDRVCYAKY